MSNPKLAIITAAFRWKNFINDYLDSIRGQTYKNIEVYICDDASRDGSVKEFLSNLSGVGLISSHPYQSRGTLNGINFNVMELGENRRQGFARNKAAYFALKNGCDALFIHDVDDFHYPNSVARHVEEWLKDPESIGLCYSDYDIYDSRTNLTIPEYKQSFYHEELHRHCTSSSNCLISRAAFEKCGPYNERISPTEDYFMSLTISNFFVQKHIPERLWRYQVHGENSTIKDLERHKQMHQVLVQDYQTWRGQQGIR